MRCRSSDVDGRRLRWGQGDFLTTATERRFAPTRYPAERALEELAAVANDPHAAERNRISVLLANRTQDQTLTVTHVQWAMFGVPPKSQFQPPHRHQSVALDFVLDCQPGCYTLLGNMDDEGNLVDVQRVDWEPGAAFVTPPGMWRSHHNESGADAHIIPIQDAGLHTY